MLQKTFISSCICGIKTTLRQRKASFVSLLRLLFDGRQQRC